VRGAEAVVSRSQEPVFHALRLMMLPVVASSFCFLWMVPNRARVRKPRWSVQKPILIFYLGIAQCGEASLQARLVRTSMEQGVRFPLPYRVNLVRKGFTFLEHCAESQ